MLKLTLAWSRRHADVINGSVTMEAAADDSPEYDAIGGSLRREVHPVFVPLRRGCVSTTNGEDFTGDRRTLGLQ